MEPQTIYMKIYITQHTLI